MSNYTKTTDFEAKDSLPTGDSGKIIRGAEFETEFDAISTAIATKADTAGPTFTGTLTFETISDGTIGVTAFVDEDDMSSDSATLVPTQQSVKAYVDSVTTELNAQDLDFQADSGGALNIDLDTETMTFTGGTGIDTSGSGNTVTFDIDSTVTTLTGTQTLTNKTLTAPVISGNLTTDGTIDGRDVATDGAKLDGIEAGATADQTDAEIRAAVEAATDSNVFTDADHTKLDGIEASATADQTDAEIRAAVEAATDSNVFTDADHTKLDGIEANATADQTDAEIRAAVEAATDSNVFTDADHTKLDGIEALADVTDTTNVTAAGALMDSELTDLTAVKSLDQGVATTDTPTFAGLTTTADVSFGDNDKAIFGAGSDLQIYHTPTGNHSIITESGSGNLILAADNLEINNAANSANKIVATTGGAVTLFHNNAAKLATTATGIDVTGTAVTDGLTVDTAIATSTASFRATTNSTTIGQKIGSLDFFNGTTNAAGTLEVRRASGGNAYSDMALMASANGNRSNQLLLSTNGDISFYEDTGTTAKLFWDASAESLGIGTSTNLANGTLNVESNGTSVLQARSDTAGVNDGDTTVVVSRAVNSTAGKWANAIYRGYSHAWSYGSNAATTEAMRIDSSGNVGVGTSSPSHKLSVSGSNSAARFSDDGTGFNLDIEHDTTNGITTLQQTNSGGDLRLQAGAASGLLMFDAGGTERMRLDASGNLLVGKTTTSNATAGAELNASGQIVGTFASGTHILGRNTNDGSILEFQKDGTTVGSIGSYLGAYAYIGSTGGTDTHIGFVNGSVRPATATGAALDATLDLGNSSGRFKDLHLSGIIYGVQQTLTRDSGAPLELNRTTNDGELVYFKQSGIVRGSISISGSTTSYNTTSDYRLKENVVAMSGATERLKQLNPSRFNFIGDTDTTVDGFLAHEVADIVPEAITGAKDAMRDEEYEVTPAVLDDDGNVVTKAVMGTRSVPDYQGIDQSKLVPLLVATIQELEARIAALESN